MREVITHVYAEQLRDKDKQIAKLKEYLEICQDAYDRDIAEKETEIRAWKDVATKNQEEIERLWKRLRS
jgi:hypothetical protein